MYYYVREGFQETAISEGFCKELTLTSEMLGGVLKIDGHTALTIGMGDRYHLETAPEHSLKCIKFIL